MSPRFFYRIIRPLFPVLNSIATLFDSPFQAAALALCALLIGMSKTGMQAVNMVSIPMMAVAFGAKESTGVILPMLCFADLVAVLYYRRNAEWKYVAKLLPSAVAGFFVALAVDRAIDPAWFKNLMGICIIAGLAVMFFERGARENPACGKWWFSALFGLLGGFTTMIGNAAGAVMAVYLLSMRLPKLNFVGTNAWFFLTVNYLKLPLQYFAWDNISARTLAIGAAGIPFILAGALFGIWFVKKLPEKAFRAFVTAAALLSAIVLFF